MCPKLANGLARECLDAAVKLQALQAELAGAIDNGSATSNLVRQLQSLDLVEQTMADLARLFDVIGRENGGQAPASWPVALAAMKQSALRTRLVCDVPPKEGGDSNDIELW